MFTLYLWSAPFQTAFSCSASAPEICHNLSGFYDECTMISHRRSCFIIALCFARGFEAFGALKRRQSERAELVLDGSMWDFWFQENRAVITAASV